MLEQDRELLGADVAIALEPSDNKLQLGCGGSVHALVRFRRQDRAQRAPLAGENAIQKAAGLLARLSATAPVSQVVDGLEWKNVVSATMASGGRARNIIPDVFELNLNQRFGPGTSVEQAKSEIVALVAGDAEVEFVDVSPSAPPHRAHPLVQALSESGVLAVEPKQAWTDVARFSAFGIPAANFGPGVQAQAHQKNEWTNLPALDVGQRVLRTWLSKIAASAVAVLALGLALAPMGCQGSASRQERARADAVAGNEEPKPRSSVRASPRRSSSSRADSTRKPACSRSRSTRAAACSRSRTRPEGRLLEYEYKQGAFGEPRLVELRGTGDLDENLFTLDSVRLAALPDLLGAAVEKVDSHDGRATRILVRRNLPQSEDVRVRVFVDSPRRSASTSTAPPTDSRSRALSVGPDRDRGSRCRRLHGGRLALAAPRPRDLPVRAPAARAARGRDT